MPGTLANLSNKLYGWSKSQWTMLTWWHSLEPWADIGLQTVNRTPYACRYSIKATFTLKMQAMYPKVCFAVHELNTWISISSSTSTNTWNNLLPQLLRPDLSHGRFKTVAEDVLFSQWGHSTVQTVFNCLEKIPYYTSHLPLLTPY